MGLAEANPGTGGVMVYVGGVICGVGIGSPLLVLNIGGIKGYIPGGGSGGKVNVFVVG